MSDQYAEYYRRQRWQEWRDNALILLVAGVVLGLIVGIIYAMVREARQWEAFAAEHNCKVVGHMTGSVASTVGVGGDGKVVSGVTTTPSKTGYLCDDGVTYWR
jgi:hypothetical protein